MTWPMSEMVFFFFHFFHFFLFIFFCTMSFWLILVVAISLMEPFVGCPEFCIDPLNVFIRFLYVLAFPVFSIV